MSVSFPPRLQNSYLLTLLEEKFVHILSMAQQYNPIFAEQKYKNTIFIGYKQN